MAKFSSMWKSFKAAQKGTVAVTFALTLIPLVAAAGVAIDFGRFNLVHTQIATALDAASLAGAAATGKTDAERKIIAHDTFMANIDGKYAAKEKAEATFDVNNNIVTGHGKAIMEPTFLSIIGVGDTDITVKNEVGLPEARKAEVALVLDYSGSMGDPIGGQTKYVAMSKAATDLIDTLTSKDPSKVKIGLVPFSHHVYTTLPTDFVAGATTSPWTGCTQDRLYPLNLVDTTPVAGDDATKWGQPQAPAHANFGCNGWINNVGKADGKGYAYHNLKIMPLTNNFTALKSQLASMTPYAWTHVPLGVEFGYHVLSPNAPYNEGADYKDKSVSKFLVLLTDGTQTEPAFGPNGTRSVAQGDSNLEALCDNVKKSGIHIVTIAYDLDDSDQRQRLASCANDPTNDFFVVNSGAELSTAFASITAAISQQVFLSK